jgi:uncharacterized protein (TIGR00159 family)
MIQAFITIRILDVIDILLVAFLIYKIYQLIKGTVAMNIFVGIFSFYLLWIIVVTLNMELLGSILGKIIGVGVIALIIVFQQEIRRFLLMIGNQYFTNRAFSLENLFSLNIRATTDIRAKAIVKACTNLGNEYIGALIVIARKSQLKMYAETGDMIDAETSNRLLESIFMKKSPLHDGAVIINKSRINAARCVLPVSANVNLPPYFGMRHRAAIGITESTDAFVIVVSEERGEISIAEAGKIHTNISPKQLMNTLEEKFISK